MLVRRNIQEEGHNLIDVHNLDAFLQRVARLEVRAPGEADGLHHVGEDVVELHLQLLSLPELLALVLLPAGHDEGRGRGGDEPTDAEVVVQRRQNLGAVCVDHNLEARLGHQEDVLGPGEAGVLETLRDGGVVQGGNLQLSVSHVGAHTNHVGHSQLAPNTSHDLASLKICLIFKGHFTGTFVGENLRKIGKYHGKFGNSSQEIVINFLNLKLPGARREQEHRILLSV